ncbi:MAG: thioredoxin family protein [Chloroflexi bacterium]|nr:thioredoxin family protein [Chloroflexota bacterium]
MDIKVLGPGCSRCRQVEQTIREVITDLAVEARIEEVRDIKKIMSYPLLATPGIVINEELVCSGRVPNKAEVTTFVVNALDKEERFRRT